MAGLVTWGRRVLLVGALTVCGTSPAMAAPDPSLILFLTFDEVKGKTATDMSGNENHAELKGGAKIGEGKYGNGLALNVNAHAEVAHKDMFNLQAMTLMTWLRFLQDTGDQQSAIEKEPAWGPGEYNLLGDYNNHILLQMNDLPDECDDECEAGEVMDGKWHHIAGTWDTTKIVIYADGEKLKECPCKGKIEAAKGLLYIGARGGGQRWTMGFYDDMKVFNRALSRDEVRAAMAETVAFPVEPRGRATAVWAALKARATR
jgi:hypothetical protein